MRDSRSCNIREELETNCGIPPQECLSCPRSTSGGRLVRNNNEPRCFINSVPDVVLASVLQLIPQRERIRVGSLVCRRWLNLIRSRICRTQTVICISSAIVARLRQLSPTAQRAAIRTLVAYSRHAKLIINLRESVYSSRHGSFLQFPVLLAILRELREVGSIVIYVQCPAGARLLMGAFVGLLQRSADTLVNLEIREGYLAEATLAALLSKAPPLWGRFSSQQKKAADAFISAAAALEASTVSHKLRSSCCCNCGLKNAAEGFQSMLMATAQILRHRMEPPPLPSWVRRRERVAGSDSEQQQGHAKRQLGERTANNDCFLNPPKECNCLSWEASGRGSRIGALRSDLRCRLLEIESCCCCRSAAETAFLLRSSFQHVRLLLPRLKTLSVGSWRLLQALHCPCLEELVLTSNSARQRIATSRQQPQHDGTVQLSQTMGEGADVFPGAAEPTGVGTVIHRSSSALQDLLLFLLRCGSSLRLMEGLYSVGAINEALVQQLCAAGAALCPPSDATAVAGHREASFSASAAHSEESSVETSATEARRRRQHGAFVAAAMAAVDAIVERTPGSCGLSSSPGTLHTCATMHEAPYRRHSSPVQGREVQPLGDHSGAGFRSTAAEQTSFYVKAMAADQAAAMSASSLFLKDGDGVFAAAAALCATAGNGCRHLRHSTDICCAVPCAWGYDGELLLVMVPRLRVAHLPDFLLLSLLLLPRLEKLRLCDALGESSSNAASEFARLWAYLSVYGGCLRALEIEGKTPPLAAFLGAGTTGEPLSFNVRPSEAAATKALRLLLQVHRMHPLMDPAFSSVCGLAANSLSRTRTTAAAAASTAAMANSQIAPPSACAVNSSGPNPHNPGQLAQQLQQQLRPLEGGQELSRGCVHTAAGDMGAGGVREGGRIRDERSIRRIEVRDSRAADETGKRKVRYGLKFGLLRRLRCHSSFLPYLVEPLPQCGALRELNVEGDLNEIMWFVASLEGIDCICVGDSILDGSARRRVAVEEPSYSEAEVSSSNSNSLRGRQMVTLGLRNYVGTACFFGPHLRCPNLRQIQVERADADFDSFLTENGAPNLEILHYQGHLFGGRGPSTSRGAATSHQLGAVHNSDSREERVQQVPQLLDLPHCLSSKVSPFSSLRELHVRTLDAKAVLRLAFSTTEAANPLLASAWHQALLGRREQRQLSLQRCQQLIGHRNQMLREQESIRLALRQRRLYEAYRARRRRLRRACTAMATEQQRQERPVERPEEHSRLSRELNSMRQQLKQLQRRLEAIATGKTCEDVRGLKKQQQQQQQWRHRVLLGLQGLQRVRSHHQRLIKFQRLLRINATDSSFPPFRETGGGSELRGLAELEEARRRSWQQAGREGNFGCSRNWCFWACHRAVDAFSRLLPHLRICVVQQLRGNTSSLRLLLRGLPKLEVFAVQEGPRNPRRQQLAQLASSLGFTFRCGCLTIPALRSSLTGWESSTVSRRFRILSRSPIGVRTTTSSVAAANLLARELLEKYTEALRGNVVKTSLVDTAAPAGAPTSALSRSVVPQFPCPPSAEGYLVSSSRTANQTAAFFNVMNSRRSEVDYSEVPGATSSLSCIDAHALRCCLYGRKRRRGSTCTKSQSPVSKRRSRDLSSDGGRLVDDAQRDLQMARTLAEELEEQLTS